MDVHLYPCQQGKAEQRGQYQNDMKGKEVILLCFAGLWSWESPMTNLDFRKQRQRSLAAFFRIASSGLPTRPL